MGELSRANNVVYGLVSSRYVCVCVHMLEESSADSGD